MFQFFKLFFKIIILHHTYALHNLYSYLLEFQARIEHKADVWQIKYENHNLEIWSIAFAFPCRFLLQAYLLNVYNIAI